jgi:hypothetical protein
VIYSPQMKDPNSENLLYLKPGTNLLLLSSGPSLCSFPNDRPNCVLNFELNDFPHSFSNVLSKLTIFYMSLDSIPSQLSFLSFQEKLFKCEAGENLNFSFGTECMSLNWPNCIPSGRMHLGLEFFFLQWDPIRLVSVHKFCH